MNSNPKLTLVIPTLDRLPMLLEALESARMQKFDGLELLLIDGGSRDGTLEVLAEMPDVRLIEDRRLGLYDALNQGIEEARGEIVGFLNSDDILPPGALAAAEAAFRQEPSARAVCGHAELVDEKGRRTLYDQPEDIRLDAHAALVGASIFNARFFTRAALLALPRFDTTYRFAADRKFLADCIEAGFSFSPVDALVYRYRAHGGSLTFAPQSGRDRRMREELKRLALDVRKSTRNGALAWKAWALEGRCRLALARDALARSGATSAIRELFGRQGGGAIAGPRALAVAAIDVAATLRRRP